MKVRGKYFVVSVGLLVGMTLAHFAFQKPAEDSASVSAQVIEQSSTAGNFVKQAGKLPDTNQKAESEDQKDDGLKLPKAEFDQEQKIQVEHFFNLKNADELKSRNRIEFSLLDKDSINAIHNAVVTDLVVRASDDFTWVGKLDQTQGAFITLTYFKGYWAGGVIDSDGQQFSLQHEADSGHVIRRLRSVDFGEDMAGNMIATIDNDIGNKAANLEASNPEKVFSVSAVANTIIDVAMGFSADAVAYAGSENATLAIINNAVAFANQVSLNSQAKLSFRLVGTQFLNFQSSRSTGTELNNMSSLTDLGWNTQLNNLRDRTGADLVTLVIGSSPSGTVGTAYVLPSISNQSSSRFAGKSSVVINFLNTIVLSHEWGHNFGLAHQDGNGALFAYGKAHQFVAGGLTRKTALWTPYSNATTNIPYFSNPNVLYQAVPTGISATNNEALALANAAATIASLRNSVTPDTPTPTTVPQPPPTPTTNPPPPPPTPTTIPVPPTPTTVPQPPGPPTPPTPTVVAPIITFTSPDRAVAEGSAVTILISGSGVPPFRFSWVKLQTGQTMIDGDADRNGSVISGSATAALTFTNIRASDTGSYRVTVTDTRGSTSRVINIAVVTASSAAKLTAITSLDYMFRFNDSDFASGFGFSTSRKIHITDLLIDSALNGTSNNVALYDQNGVLIQYFSVNTGTQQGRLNVSVPVSVTLLPGKYYISAAFNGYHRMDTAAVKMSAPLQFIGAFRTANYSTTPIIGVGTQTMRGFINFRFTLQ